MQALALIEGRDYAIPDDVKRLAVPLFAHRVVINTRTTLAQRRADAGRAHHRRNSQPGGSSPVDAPIMKTAIIGLPMVGKTSLFTILTGVHQETRIGSTAARTGVAKVPDARLDALAKLFEPNKITHATVEYVDMPSISKENLRDPSYLASLRVVDAFAHVLRLFADETVPHEKGSVDPDARSRGRRDGADPERLVVIEKRLERLERTARRSRIPSSTASSNCLQRCKPLLEENRPLRELELDADDEKRIRGFQFLSQKPMLYVLNLGEADAGDCTSAKRSTATVRWPDARTRPSPPSAARSKRSWPNCRARSSRNTWPATA